MLQLWQKLQADGNKAILARGAIGVFVIKIAGAGILLGLHVLLARILGVTEYGIYIYAITWLNILTILSLFGFHTSIVRFVPEYKIKGQWGLLRGILCRSTKIVLALSIFISIAGLIIVLFLSNNTHRKTNVFYIVFALLPIFSLCKLRESALRSLKLVVQSELLLMIIRPAVLAAIVLFCFCLSQDSFDAYYAMACNLISVCVVFSIGTFFLYWALPTAVKNNSAQYAQTEWFKVSLPLLFITGMHLILKRTDIIMLNILRAPDDAGIYAAASRISDIVVLGLVAVNSILAPIVSELYHSHNINELKKIIARAAKSIFYYTVSISAILIIWGKPILSCFGHEFTNAFSSLVLLCLTQIISAVAGPVSLIMSMTGNQNKVGAIVAMVAFLNIFLNFILISYFGILGAAISTGLCLCAKNITLFFYVNSRVKLNPTIFANRANRK